MQRGGDAKEKVSSSFVFLNLPAFVMTSLMLSISATSATHFSAVLLPASCCHPAEFCWKTIPNGEVPFPDFLNEEINYRTDFLLVCFVCF